MRFETFVRDIADLREGRPAILVLRDLTPGRRKYFARHAVATVTRNGSEEAGLDRLVVRSMVGNPYPGSWWVKVLDWLPQRVPGTPYTDAFEAMDQAWARAVAR